jgi:hypothetical protein
LSAARLAVEVAGARGPVEDRSMKRALPALAAAVVAITLSCAAEPAPPAGPSPAPAASGEASARPTVGARAAPENLDMAEAHPAGPGDGDSPVRRSELTAPVFVVDREYRSMAGPQKTLRFRLTEKPELLWLTGYRAVMVGEDGATPMPQDYMCHSNLDLDSVKHQQRFRHQRTGDGRLFTLSQGQLEIDLPPGFGIPVWSDEDLSLTAQVLNLNPGADPVKVRHKITIEYVRDADLKEPMKPLVQAGVYGMKLLHGDAGHLGLESPDPEKHGPGCLPGRAASPGQYRDDLGRIFTGHWVVEPGVEENHTRVTPMLNLAEDTTAHYIAVHLHPFAERVELRDLTAKETVFASDVEPLDGRIGIERVDFYSSEEGIPLAKDHEYELVSFYANTTDEPQDSMAVLYVYLLDKGFDRSQVTRRAAAEPAEPLKPTS